MATPKENRMLEYYFSKLEIDPNDLKSSILSQSQHYYEVCKELNNSRDKELSAKMDLEICEKELSHRIRKRFEVNKIKFTEGKINEMVHIDGDYTYLQEYYIKARKSTQDWDNMKEAFIQRSFMLRELARIYALEYGGDPAVLDTVAKQAVIDSHNRQTRRYKHEKR